MSAAVPRPPKRASPTPKAASSPTPPRPAWFSRCRRERRVGSASPPSSSVRQYLIYRRMVGTAQAAPLPTLRFHFSVSSRPLRCVVALLAAGLEQEPGAALGLVDEGLQQSGGAGILVIVAKLVGFPHRGGHVLVVFHQLAQHLARRHIALIVVVDGLQFADLPDRAQRGAAQLANPFGQLIGGGENIVGLLVEQQMIVAEMPAADMPVKVLGLDIRREGVGQRG